MLLLGVATVFVWTTQMASALAGVDLMPAKLAELLVLLGLAVAITRATDGRGGIRQLFAGLLRWRLGWRYLLLLLPMPLLTIGVAAATGTFHAPAAGWVAVGLTYLFFLVLGAVTGNLWEETVWGAFVQGRLMARHGLLVGSLLTAVPCLPRSSASRVRDQWLARHYVARRLDQLGSAAPRGTVPAVPDRHPAHRHRRQHPRRGLDARLDQRRRRHGRHPGRLAAGPRFDGAHPCCRRVPELARTVPDRRVRARSHPSVGGRGTHLSRDDAVSAAAVLQGPPISTAHTPANTVLLHLGPGAAAFAAYVGLVPVARQLGLPSVAALGATGLLVIAPIQLGLLRTHRRRRPDEPAVQLRGRLPLPQLLGWAGIEVILAGLVFLGTAPLTRLLQTRVFTWWPDQWTVNLGTEASYSDTALVVTAALLLVGTVLTAPVVEELYFRGYLLPRMPYQFGPWKLEAHVALFAGYHLWTPWLAPDPHRRGLPLGLHRAADPRRPGRHRRPRPTERHRPDRPPGLRRQPLKSVGPALRSAPMAAGDRRSTPTQLIKRSNNPRR